MLTSSSEKPFLAFSSTFLSSVDRLVRGIEQRIQPSAISKSLHRLDGFVDRFFLNRWASVGLHSERWQNLFSPREIPFPSLQNVDTWIPSVEELRGEPVLQRTAPTAGVSGKGSVNRPNLTLVTPDRQSMEKKSVPRARKPSFRQTAPRNGLVFRLKRARRRLAKVQPRIF